MQLLDDDMDELFRNAASDYPLNTGGGDWEAMQNKLQQADNNQQGTATRRLRDRWWFKPGLWVLVTILFLIVAVSGLFTGNRKGTGREGIAGDKTAEVATSENKQRATATQSGQEVNKEGNTTATENATGKKDGTGAESVDNNTNTNEHSSYPNTSDNKGSSSSTLNNTARTNTPALGNTSSTKEENGKRAVVAAGKVNTGNTGSTNEGNSKPSVVAAGKVNTGNTGSTNEGNSKPSIVAAGKVNTGNTDRTVAGVVKPLTAPAGSTPSATSDKPGTQQTGEKSNTGLTLSATRKTPKVLQTNIPNGKIQLANDKPSTTNNISIVKGDRSTTDEDDQPNTRERVVLQKQQKVAANVAGRDKHSSTGNSEQSIVNSKTGNIPVRTGESQDTPNSSYPAARSGITAVHVSPLAIERIKGVADRNTLPQTSLLHVDRTINIPAGALSDNSATASSEKVKREPASLKKGLYYGLVFSPDITTVKFQRSSSLGYNIGLLAGYRFGKKLAVETGVLYERKYYYSTAEYFDKTKTPWPADMDLLSVDGWCNMYEIPVNVRFTFATGKKSSWYANAGMSSYIMKKQKYDYSYQYYGQYGERNWTYRKTTADWFAVIHLGIGYERPVGVLGTLRVEPYIKIPTRGIGIGDLPVTSAGLNIGLTRPLRLK